MKAKDLSNRSLLEYFELAVMDKNYNPTNEPYNESGIPYYELEAELLRRLEER
jgi:hypothetical protein